MITLFTGVPKEFLIQRYVETQDDYGHVVRLTDQSISNRDFDIITQNIYSLSKIPDVSNHYKRGALKTLIIIEARSLRRLIGDLGPFIDEVSTEPNLDFFISIHGGHSPSLTQHKSFLKKVDRIYYAPESSKDPRDLLRVDHAESYCLLDREKGSVSQIQSPDPVPIKLVRTYRTLLKIKLDKRSGW